MNEASGRVFLFLQGPHGPFFRRLAARLAGQGGAIRRIAFNAADQAEWRGVGPLDRYLGPPMSYRAWLARYLEAHGVTDIVLYGDARPEHAQAVAAAHQRGILCHCLEEGYLRPHWITYERWGTNGNSPLNDISLERMAAALGPADPPTGLPADQWGAYQAHLWHAAQYHLRLLLPSKRYGRYRSRRGLALWRELALYLARLAGLPWRRLTQTLRARRFLSGGARYHLALLQLSFDTSMQVHSSYPRAADFAADCIAAFARGAPADQLLVFKSHPFEDGRERLGQVIRHQATGHGVAGRVLFLDGGPRLSTLLDGASSAVTVNSTAAQQALWRGLPVAALGRAVYARPGLTSDQDLAAFFADPHRPDQHKYWVFRRFLTETSQMRGSFYSSAGIAELLDSLPAALLAAQEPYERVLSAAAADPVQQENTPEDAPAGAQHSAPESPSRNVAQGTVEESPRLVAV